MPLSYASQCSYDPYDVEINRDPYPHYRLLREESPLYYNEQYDFFAVSRHADVVNGLIGHETFSSARGIFLETIRADMDIPSGMVIHEDPPRHDVHRGLMSRVFTPKKVAALEPMIREYCTRCLDNVAGRTEFDFVTDLAALVPTRVIGMLLGIPEEDQAAVRDRGNANVQTEPGRPMAPSDVSGEMFADYVEWRTEHPSDDLMTALLNAEFQDETGTVRRLTREEVLAYTNVLALGGNGTTNRLIGWTGKLLGDHPDQRRALAADPSGIPDAIEEILRYEPPVPYLGRYVTRDVEVHGHNVPEGSVMLLLVASANRDDAPFPDGDRFDIARAPGPILTFGRGIHFCMGAALARMEARIALEEMLARFPDWDVDTERARLWSTSSIRGYETLPVTVPG